MPLLCFIVYLCQVRNAKSPRERRCYRRTNAPGLITHRVPSSVRCAHSLPKKLGGLHRALSEAGTESSPDCRSLADTGRLLLLVFFLFSFFLWGQLGLFLLLPFPLVLFSLVTHIRPPFMKITCAGPWRRESPSVVTVDRRDFPPSRLPVSRASASRHGMRADNRFYGFCPSIFIILGYSEKDVHRAPGTVISADAN